MEILGFDYEKHLDNYEKEKANEEKIRNKIIDMARGLEKNWELLRVHRPEQSTLEQKNVREMAKLENSRK